MARLLDPIIGEGVRIEVRTAEGLWPIFADPTQIESAVLNLAFNARDAMSKGGTLIIEAVNMRREKVALETVPLGYVMIEVTDTGICMWRELGERVLQSVFTTKPAVGDTDAGL